MSDECQEFEQAFNRFVEVEELLSKMGVSSSQRIEEEFGFKPFSHWLRMGECLYRLDQCDKGIQYLDRATSPSSDDDVCQVETLRGKCLDRLRLFQEAIAAYQSALVVA